MNKHICIYTLSALAGLLLSQNLYALPTSCEQTHGTVTHKINDKIMTVTSKSPTASAKFEFDNNTLIAKGERIHISQKKDATFIMETDSVQRADIFGKLTSPGSVVMAFPGGVHFKDGSSVNVANLLVVAGKIDHTILNDNKIRAIKNSGVKGANIINEGEITIKDAGLVAFVAPNALNYGSIIAFEDKAYLGNGSTIIDLYGDGLIKFQIPKGVCQNSLTKARKKAKDLGARNGILVFDTQEAIDALKTIVNIEIENSDSIFIDINENINTYCSSVPPVAPQSCGTDCGCGHIPTSSSKETKNTPSPSTSIPSPIPHKTTNAPSLPTKNIIIVNDITPAPQKTGPCDCGCAHAATPLQNNPSGLSSSHHPLHFPVFYKQQEIKEAFSLKEMEMVNYSSPENDTENVTQYEIITYNGNEELLVSPPKKRRKKR